MEKNEYILSKNTFYSKDQLFRWRAGYGEALTILGIAPEFTSKEELFEYYSFSDSVMETMGHWSFQDLVLSALFLYLETVILENKKSKKDFLTIYNWKKISALLMNTFLSSDVLQLIRDLDLEKHSSEKIIFFGSKKAIANLYGCDKPYLNKKGLINLLLFLKIDLASSEILVTEAFENQSAANIKAFLSSFE